LIRNLRFVIKTRKERTDDNDHEQEENAWITSVIPGFLEFCGSETALFTVPDAQVFLFCLVLPGAIVVQRPDSRHDMGMGIMSVRVMDRCVNAHAFIDKLRLNVFRQDGNPLILVQFDRQRDDMFTGKAAFLSQNRQNRPKPADPILTHRHAMI
jgi:hypothetical protein